MLQHVDVSQCRNFVLSKSQVQYNSKDVCLYAISLGVGVNPMDEEDLKFTYENSEDFSAIPSLSVTFVDLVKIFDSLSSCPGLPSFNPMMLLHGYENICIYKEILTSGEVNEKSFIYDVQDKKSGALVIIHTNCMDKTGMKICDIEIGFFIKGLGGFDNNDKKEKEKKEGRGGIVPERLEVLEQNFSKKIKNVEAHIVEKQTNRSQAILYRLNGDLNPLHIDPKMSALGGFEIPILHGLCTFGIAVHSIIKHVNKNNVTNINYIGAKFTSVVTPGDILQIKIYKFKERDDCVLFQVINKNTKNICVNNGIIGFDHLKSNL